MREKVYYFTQEVLFETEHWGKHYYWLKDVDGKVYMVRKGEDGNPVF